MPARKSRRRRATLALLCAATSLALGPRAASADGWQDQVSKAGAITLDAALLRPVSALSLVMGCVFFVASVPLVAPFEGIDESFDTFVYSPYEWTFLRDLGDL